MKPSADQLTLMASLYDAAVDPSHWVGLLDRLAAEVGAKGSAILVLETLRQYSYSINLTCSLYRPEDIKQYESCYAQYEALHFANVARGPRGQIVLDAGYVADPVTFRQRPDVAFLEREYGVFERFGIKLNDEKAWFDCLTFQYDAHRPNISAAEKEVLAMFVPHVAKTIDLSRSFTELRSRYNAVLGVLDRFLIPVFLVFSSSKVLLANSTARALAEQRDGLSTTPDGLLIANDARANLQLKAAIERACATAVGGQHGGATRFLVAKRSGRDPLLVDVSPLRDTNNELDERYRGALVSVVDPDLGTPMSTDGLAELYELTPVEAQIAQLVVSGRTNSEIAEMRGKSPETIATQVKAVLGKTGCRNRTELVNRLLTINLPVG